MRFLERHYRRAVAEKGAVEENLRRRQRAQPVEVTSFELLVGWSVPGAHLVRSAVDQVAIVIAADADGAAGDQEIDGAGRVHRTAGGVTKIDDAGNALRANVIQHRFQREMISVHIGDRREFHRMSRP